MSVAPQFPSAYNTYIPSTSATNKLKIDFSHNPKDFSINKWCQIINVKENTGLYTRMTNEVCSRYVNDGKGSVWGDGDERPKGLHNLESFKMEQYRTVRYNYPVTFGQMTIDQASWDIEAQYQRILGSQAMTARANRCISVATNTSNYDSSHVIDVSNTSGIPSRWDASITADLSIKKSLNIAQNLILRDTLGCVQAKDLILVISPTVAAKLSETQEIADYIKGSPDAYKYTKGELETSNSYGLPEKLYGINVVVDNTVSVTSAKGSARTTAFSFPSDKALLISRPGGLIGYEGPNFSTMCMFMKEDMTYESFPDPENRRVKLSITDEYVPMLIAPISGVVFSNILTA